MENNTANEIAKGIGMALGLLLRLAANIFMVWLSLWILAQFNWLPF